MKKILKPLLIVALFIAAISATVLSLAQKPHPKVVLTGNDSYEAIDIFPHAYQCARCKMEIVKTDFAAEAVMKDGKTLFFDDVGCLALWLPEYEPVKLWVYAKDKKGWIDAKSAFYSIGNDTPMHYGFVAVSKECDRCVTFEKMVEMMQKGEHMANPKFAKTVENSR